MFSVMNDMTSEQKQIIQRTAEYVKTVMKDLQVVEYDQGHDWRHIQRVWNNAKFLAREESKKEYENHEKEHRINLFIVELSALLHDIDDWKFSDETKESRVDKWLDSFNLDYESKKHILHIINNLSFKGACV